MNKKDLNNKIFITILILISCFFMIFTFRNSRYVNLVDNRQAYRFSMPTMKSLISGEYQDSIDETIADQLPKYNYFKLLYLKIVNYTNIKTINLLDLNKPNEYVKLSNIYLYNDYLLYGTEYNKDTKNFIKETNNLIDNTDSNVYLYFINTDLNHNFKTGELTDTFNNIKNSVKTNNIDSLKYDSFDEYKEYFYKTDHHWNYKGAYKGYTDIASLMNLDVPKIKDTICVNKFFNGSKFRDIAGLKIINDEACVYDFDLPEFDIYISGKKADDYGSPIEKLDQTNEITYAYLYGADYDEIIFINKETNSDKNLLIYSNSYSNAINKLLASNYKKTFVIDGRHYNGESMIDYIKDKKIDDVIIISNNVLLSDNINW